MRTKVKVAAIVAAVTLTALACFVLGHCREHDARVSLTFQRYSDLDPYVGDVVFLNLTNASNQTYLLCMTGNTNTWVSDTSFGHSKRSCMVNCEFSDQTPDGWTNWVQPASPVRGSNAYTSLAPHSGMVVRVPLPPKGQQRKVAVLYEPAPAGWRPSPFWRRISGRQPLLLRAWCDRALTNQWGNIGQQ